MRTLLTLFIISISAACFGQTYDLKDFVEVPSSKPYSAEWYGFNGSKWNFSPEIIKGKLILKDFKYTPPADYVLPNGTLWAIDQGEFGGMLYYQPNDINQTVININGKNNTLKDCSRGLYAAFTKDQNIKAKFKNKQFELMPSNIKRFFKFRDSLYFTEGLGHMGTNYGAVYKIDIQQEKGTITKTLELAEEPNSMIIKGNIVYITTTSKFYVFNSWKKELEIDNLEWQGIGPYDLAMADKNTFYVGLMHGYAKLDLKTKKLTVYKYVKLNQ